VGVIAEVTVHCTVVIVVDCCIVLVGVIAEVTVHCTVEGARRKQSAGIRGWNTNLLPNRNLQWHVAFPN